MLLEVNKSQRPIEGSGLFVTFILRCDRTSAWIGEEFSLEERARP